MRPNRARMGDTLLSELVLLRCNNAMYLDVLYADSVFVCCLNVLRLTVTVACEDYGRRVILMISTCLELNKMHYSMLPIDID